MDSEPLTYWISSLIMASCRITEITQIFFLIPQIFIPSSKFKSAYFIFLIIGYLWDLLLGGIWVDFVIRKTINQFQMNSEWFDTYFSTVWSTLLACNRCTALIFPFMQDKIWSKSRTWIAVILLILSPFIIDGYNLINFPFNFNIMSLERKTFREGYLIRGAIINAALTILVLTFVGYAIYKSRNFTSSIAAKCEKRLIYQALISSIFSLANFGIKYYSTKLSYNNMNYFALKTNISAMVYYFHNSSIIITHFIFSPSFRKAFFKFYFKIFCFCKNSQNTVFFVTDSNERRRNNNLPKPVA